MPVTTHTAQRPADRYTPLYFLASVGAGGLAVSFFMWLMHWIPHPGRTAPNFEDIASAFGSGGLLTQAMIVASMAGIAIFGVLNLKSLVWNIGQYRRWSTTEGAAALRSSNAETQQLAMPLAFAMSINVGFILGLTFVPGLWSVVEYLFPLAIIAFVAVGVLAFRMIGGFLGRVLGKGGFNCAANNNFGQVMPAFALAMVGVGLAAPAAMSSNATVAGISLVLASFFMVASVLIAGLGLILGVRSLMENGANIETAPTLSIFVPLFTVLGILSLRTSHGLGVHFDVETLGADRLMQLTQFLSLQVLFLLFAGVVLARLGYVARFITGRDASAGSYALVCPGVALSVMLHFWLNKGLVDAGLVVKFGVAYWTITALALVVQAATVWLVLVLNRKHFGAPRTVQAVPAE